MLTLTQIIGTIIAILLTGLFLAIGYQLIVILQELRQIINKTNHIIDDASRITKSIADPAVSLSGFLTGLKNGIQIINLFTNNKTKKGKNTHD